MKNSLSYKNTFSYLLGTLISVWAVYGIMIAGQYFQIFRYGTISGRFLLLLASILPSFLLYIKFKAEYDSYLLKDFIRFCISGKKIITTFLVAFVFSVIHITSCVLTGIWQHRSPEMIVLMVPILFIASGLQESALRGYLQPAIEEILPFYLGNFLTGSLWACFYIPLWWVAGNPFTGMHFAYLVIYCTFMSIMLHAVNDLTESVLACMIFRTAGTLMLYCFSGLYFQNNRVTILFMLEMLLATICSIIANKTGKKTLCILGSSVAYGYASDGVAVGEYLAKQLHYRLVKEAVSGTTLANLDQTSYVARLRNQISKKEKIDIFICQLSTNDATKGIELGNISPITQRSDFDEKTVTGAIETILSYVSKTWNCKIYFFTGSRYESVAYDRMVKRLYQLKEKWDFEILDLWSSDSFNRITEQQRKQYMADPIHPKLEGYEEWWGPELKRQLLKCI